MRTHSYSPPSSSSYKDTDSVLKLLPVAILALALSLPNQDREVLAYLIARWDSSPNRELIHQAIEAFEEHLLQNESPRKHTKGRKRGKKVIMASVESIISVNKPETEVEISVGEDECEVVIVQENTEGGDMEENGVICEGEKMGENEMTRNLEMEVVSVQALEANHKGFGWCCNVLRNTIVFLQRSIIKRQFKWKLKYEGLLENSMLIAVTGR
ncbi:hypothetical protein GH714_024307 [Hevea brasiliensis]|uniref:Uncharacterized protein n=1 Tax=Hevea brasiliensis TaxID=3981 RepID=A0A6A6MGI8_HEVBR|nr:hypothetical protein GH714_024307 [Hevea brasiliensis]